MLCWFLSYKNMNRHRYTYVPSLLNLPPTPLGCHRTLGWASCYTAASHMKEYFYKPKVLELWSVSPHSPKERTSWLFFFFFYTLTLNNSFCAKASTCWAKKDRFLIILFVCSLPCFKNDLGWDVSCYPAQRKGDYDHPNGQRLKRNKSKKVHP